ncbi:MAG: hypothetical protein J6S14_03115 [Clostridia bacterium]|nr:hypothetical protein [Clostridia bacterium]
MADKSISELVMANSINERDLFVLEQNGTAKKLEGQTLTNWLVAYADGHGGIQSIELTDTSGLTKTYTITLADTTTFDLPVSDGNGIADITWTESGTAGDGKTHTGTIEFTDGTTDTIEFQDGTKGDTGAAAYVWIKYASKQPTSSSDMSDTPNSWMGIYSGTSSTAPIYYSDYKWYRILGSKGAAGTPASISSAAVNYALGTSPTEPPASGWSATIPETGSGQYLWTRVTTEWNTGNPITQYSVARNGVDGDGAVSTVLGKSPDLNGNVAFTSADVPYSSTTVESQLNALVSAVSSMQSDITGNKPKHFSITLTSLPHTVNDANITSDMRVFNTVFGDDSVVTSDLEYTTANGSITFTGSISGSTTMDFDLMKVRS